MRVHALATFGRPGQQAGVSRQRSAADASRFPSSALRATSPQGEVTEQATSAAHGGAPHGYTSAHVR